MTFRPVSLEETAQQWRQLCALSQHGSSTGSDLGLYRQVDGGYELVGMRVSAAALDELLAAQQAKIVAEKQFKALQAEVESMRQQR